jgi:hypothetical protein
MRMTLSKMLAIGLGLALAAGTASAQAPPANATSFGCSGGCSSCGTDSGGKHKHGLLIGRGTEMPVGCACCAAQKSFIFGSCNQFYSPGNDCRGCGFGRGNCHAPVGGPPYPPVPPCTYSSYTYR